jgi:hypothetical protein
VAAEPVAADSSPAETVAAESPVDAGSPAADAAPQE